jgi:hypothetical protein
VPQGTSRVLQASLDQPHHLRTRNALHQMDVVRRHHHRCAKIRYDTSFAMNAMPYRLIWEKKGHSEYSIAS